LPPFDRFRFNIDFVPVVELDPVFFDTIWGDGLGVYKPRVSVTLLRKMSAARVIDFLLSGFASFFQDFGFRFRFFGFGSKFIGEFFSPSGDKWLTVLNIVTSLGLGGDGVFGGFLDKPSLLDNHVNIVIKK
jgi:hypothetical protein